MERIVGRKGHFSLITFAFVVISSTSPSCRPPPPDYAGSSYIIVAPEGLIGEVADLVAFKQSQGFLVETVSLEDILTTMSGDDGAEKVRNYLINSYAENPGKEFVLLVGSMATMPMRIAHTDPTGDASYDVPTDYYYQELTCEWDWDGDGKYGEWEDDMTPANCDYKAEAWVGRLPWDNPSDIEVMVDTIIKFETDESDRMKRAIGASAIISEPCDAALFLELAKSTDMIISGYSSISLYEECPSLNPDFELTRYNFLGQWEALEPGFVAWFSHGDSQGSYISYNGWDTFIDTHNLPQGVAPAIAATSGCTVGDPEVESLGRVLVREGVVAGFLGSSRVTSEGTNPLPAYSAQYAMFRNFILKRQGLSAAVANGMEYYVEHEKPMTNVSGPDFNRNIFEFMIYGDPAVQAK
jgi:hypothetical protein